MTALTVSDVMTKDPRTISADAELDQAKRVMYSMGIRHLPVLRGGSCIGIISDRDIKLAFALEEDAAKLRVEDAAQGEVYTVKTSTPLHEVAEEMARQGIGSALVTDDRGSIKGIFTTTDACKALSQVLTGKTQK